MTNLLDVNVLIALAWPNHVFHASAVRWFSEHRHESFATCPITETGFIRVSMNPAAVRTPVSCENVIRTLDAYRNLPHHVFWPDDINASEAFKTRKHLSGHRQITDAYLLSLAARKKGRLVTFDKAIVSLSSEGQEICLIPAD